MMEWVYRMVSPVYNWDGERNCWIRITMCTKELLEFHRTAFHSVALDLIEFSALFAEAGTNVCVAYIYIRARTKRKSRRRSSFPE